MKIGLVGTGNMGCALISGYVKGNPKEKDSVFAYDTDDARLSKIVADTGIQICKSLEDLAEKSEIIILAVKPNVIYVVLDELKSFPFLQDKVIVSVAAGRNLEYILECLELPTAKVIRAMPNVPAMVGKGMTALVKGPSVDDESLEKVKKVFTAVGGVEETKEDLLDSVTGVSGSAPAYVYMFIEALADGAVALGMDRKQAYRFAAGTVAGAAEMVIQTGVHPGELKDMVCSPSGTTIEAVRVLEEKGFRSAVFEAVKAAGMKSREMTE